jgi:hypothetical protein
MFIYIASKRVEKICFINYMNPHKDVVINWFFATTKKNAIIIDGKNFDFFVLYLFFFKDPEKLNSNLYFQLIQ